MNAAVLGTLRCARTLQTAGFPPAQAEAMAQVLADALSDVATKADLDNAVGSLESSIAHLDDCCIPRSFSRGFSLYIWWISTGFPTLSGRVCRVASSEVGLG